MADRRIYALNPQLDISQILVEAQNRWLRPSEICEILRNYQNFCLAPDPPIKPPSGSLFLFDRKALRYFRKDGHCWRKKKDGKTVREAHEKLKSGSVDVLHCYYAHGEDNENFQRRSYWMLDGQLEHIVLVHYREVKEGHRSGISCLLNTDQGTMNYAGGAQISSGIFPAQVNSLAHAAQPSYASSPSTANWNGAQSSELEDADSGDDYGASSLSRPISCSGFQISSLHVDNSTVKNASGNGGTLSRPYSRVSADAAGMNNGFCYPFYVNQVAPPSLLENEGHQTSYRASQESRLSESSRKQLTPGLFGGTSFNPEDFSSTWSESLIASMHEHKNLFGHANDADFISRKLTNSTFGPYLQTFTRDTAQVHLNEENFEHVDFPSGMQGNNFNLNPQFESKGVSRVSITTSEQSLGLKAEGHHSTKKAPESSLCDHEVGLKKLDSFGRWMNKEIGKDCDDSLMASDSGNYWNTLDPQNDEKEVSSLSRHMQLHVDSLGPSLSQEQLFSILDFSPDWSYSRVETKVLITGTFLGGVEHPRTNWCCMFGEVEVSAEVLTNNALRCHAPAHGPGRVPFYITCSNRLACSEVREFEYREKPSGPTYSIAVKSEPQDEIRLQIRLAKMLSPRVDKKCFESFDCSAEQCEKCSLKKNILSMRGDDGSEWGMVQKAAKASEGNIEHPRDALIQKLLRDRLYEWLVCKTHEEGKGPNVLDDDGQGVIHLAAALGYDWAMDPIVAAGVSPSFRDTRGRTGLHWAAYFGREETVVSLLRLGAAPGAVEDPTSSFPEERTAADLASSRGHKGIAGYLAEADLTSHLSSLRLKDSIIDGVSATATLAAEKTIEIIGEHAIVPLDGDKESLSLKGSLAAMRNSAQAAARIQAAFRLNSFRHTRSTECSDANELVALVSLNNRGQKVGHFSDSLHAAAIRIQQKYRGWKGRNDFLKMRSRIVKIQAHVRGHQVRKQYKKVVWSVSIVEKAILRWRRKGAGLRGFRADKAIEDSDPKSGKIDEYDFLRVGRKQKFAVVEKALARVQSMVRHPEARDQYMRLATNSQKSKMMANEGNESSKNQQSEGNESTKNQSFGESKVDDNLGTNMTRYKHD